MIVGRYEFYGNNLYFLNSHGDEEEIREVPDGSSEHDVLGMVLEDLKNRNPEYKSYYLIIKECGWTTIRGSGLMWDPIQSFI